MGFSPWLVVIEMMQYGDLRKVVQACYTKKKMLTYYEMLNLGQQIAKGLDYIATNGWVHMDVAARNILVHEKSHVKIADFGIVRWMCGRRGASSFSRLYTTSPILSQRQKRLTRILVSITSRNTFGWR